MQFSLQASKFRKIIDAIHELIDEANFVCTPQGISLCALDATHVSLVYLELQAVGFDTYTCLHPTNVGLSIKTVAKILKTTSYPPDATVTVTMPDAESDTYSLGIACASFPEKTTEYTLKLMSIENDALEIPDRRYASCIKLASSELYCICKDLGVIGDTVSITLDADENTAMFKTSGDVGEASILLSDMCVGYQAVSHTFSLRYILSFLRSLLSPEVSLSLAPNFPMKVCYDLGELGMLSFYLAPKVADEEETVSDEEPGC